MGSIIEVDKKAYFTKKYLDVFTMLIKRSQKLREHRIEAGGGSNMITPRPNAERAKRMKFSTTTIPDVRNAYENLMPLDISKAMRAR